MEIKDMTIEQVEERKLAIVEEMKAEGADLDALETEMRALVDRQTELATAAEERAKIVDEVLKAPTAEPIIPEERKNKSMEELRNTKAYIDAYADYIKTGKDEEIRTLLSENATEDGTIAVPEFVYDIVKTAWDKNEIMALVNKTELAGNLKVNFEISGDDAIWHEEGDEAVDEEELVEGIAKLEPQFLKKWISISDEVMALRGDAFLRYIYDEITHKIIKGMADTVVDTIMQSPAIATSTEASVAQIETEPTIATVAEAIGHLSDEANNPVIIMNKLTWAEFKRIQYGNGYGVDPFEGLRVLFNNKLPAYATADEGDVYMIVGDLGQGAMANFPNGQDIKFTFDEYSRKKEDLVEVLGKIYVGINVVADRAFTNVVKPETQSE